MTIEKQKCRNVVQFYGACIWSDSLVLVLEYMGGARPWLWKSEDVYLGTC